MINSFAKEVEDTLGNGFAALYLGGGYGHSEGGVWICEDGSEMPYNDLDFTLVMKHPVSGLEETLRPIRERYEHLLGIEVDVSRPLFVDHLSSLPHTMMWHELLHGGLCVAGEDCLRERAPQWYPELRIPLVEGTRLLLNRGAGIIWSLRISLGIDPKEDETFGIRNTHKAVLAMGDTALLAHDYYVVSYRRRVEQLSKLAQAQPEAVEPSLLRDYQSAMNFRFNPHLGKGLKPSTQELRELGKRWVNHFLAYESRRSGIRFSSPDGYARNSFLREPEQHTTKKLLRNAVRQLQRGKLSTRYPREKLYGDCCRLLSTDPTTVSWRADSERFLEVWRRYN
ncbi:MAG: hypothetical protein SFY68_12935 [Candidatus Sumerlaeia bacterium]|nr:hypothetical protein [Candidatus Sumerlaeia bacterium]